MKQVQGIRGDPEKERLQAKAASLSIEAAQKREAINRILDRFTTGDQPPALAKAAHERAATLNVLPVAAGLTAALRIVSAKSGAKTGC